MSGLQGRALQTEGWQERLIGVDPNLRVYLMGIGGAGLSAIARVLHEQGITVSGSDGRASKATQQLADLGIPVLIGQAAANLTTLPADQRPDVVLISSAVSSTNPERLAAERLGIPVVKRDDFLPVLLANRQLIAVAGAAGKSTTTAMIVKVLRDAGREIGYIIGAELPGVGNAAAGRDPLFVVEADEYDRMFLGLRPAVAVITNVVWDHPDCYPTPESFWQAFKTFVDLVPQDGLVVSCADDLGADRLHEARRRPGPCWVTYGLDEFAEVRATNLQMVAGEQRAEVSWSKTPVGQLRLPTPGAHNVRNALAALTVARHCQVELAQSLASLSRFTGAGRRFELKGVAQGVTIIDDYAHHPTKIQATLAAARSRYPAQRIWAVFQPHTFSRTHHLLAEIAGSFDKADAVIITDIYAAREADAGIVHARDLVAASGHDHIHHIATLDEAAAFLRQQVQPGDVVVVMGAGDSSRIAELLLAGLQD
jgi:UDP-N-acetylmuramate--alanine ligase